MRRYWEAHDLILEVMSTTGGPFSWEGKSFTIATSISGHDVPGADVASVDDGLALGGLRPAGGGLC